MIGSNIGAILLVTTCSRHRALHLSTAPNTQTLFRTLPAVVLSMKEVTFIDLDNDGSVFVIETSSCTGFRLESSVQTSRMKLSQTMSVCFEMSGVSDSQESNIHTSFPRDKKELFRTLAR